MFVSLQGTRCLPRYIYQDSSVSEMSGTQTHRWSRSSQWRVYWSPVWRQVLGRGLIFEGFLYQKIGEAK